uniref:Ubiquitin-like domain-containing protein n=1 Tax=Acanthochromis polyacanthus TaxID=80966 RepID=A0A3Q1G9X7_9TELE
MAVQLKVNGPRGEEKIIDLCDDEEQMKRITVLHLKKKIVHELQISTYNDVFLRDPGTQTLEESSLLSVYQIKHMSTIHTLLMLPGGHL